MPALYRLAGFHRVQVGAGTTVHAGAEGRAFWARGSLGRLAPGDPYRESWLKVGISEAEIAETRDAVQQWADDEDAWYVALQSEIVAWK